MGSGQLVNKILLLAFIMIGLIGFQNCSEGMEFTSESDRFNQSLSSDQIVTGPANITEEEAAEQYEIDSVEEEVLEEVALSEESEENESDEASHDEKNNDEEEEKVAENSPAPKDEAPDEVVTEPTIVEEEVTFAECKHYVEISANSEGVIELPTRKPANDVCYFKKILKSVANHISGRMGEVRSEEVLASNHNGNSKTYIGPFILGDVRVKFSNLPGWKIAISGAYNDPKKKLAIDNFYLVDFQYGQNPNRVQVASAFGTKDSEPGSGALPILYKDLELEFTHFANGGTASVDAIELTPGKDIASSYLGVYDLRLQALDCGGSARGNDVYLVFH